MRAITVVRFPNGSWSTGGRVSDPDYAECECYVILSESDKAAKKQAQSVRRRIVTKGQSMPTQGAPYRQPSTVD
jgi:hypothetical protein